MVTERMFCQSVITCVILASFIFMPPYAFAYEITMTFEEFLGNDRAEIGTFYPGVHFEALTTGQDWIVSDATTGNYNVSSWPTGQQWDRGEYWLYDLSTHGPAMKVTVAKFPSTKARYP